MRKTTKSLEQLELLLYRTENNIDYYISEENKGMHLINEIGTMRGLIYAWEAITGYQKQLTPRELSYINLQEELRRIDDENNIITN